MPAVLFNEARGLTDRSPDALPRPLGAVLGTALAAILNARRVERVLPERRSVRRAVDERLDQFGTPLAGRLEAQQPVHTPRRCGQLPRAGDLVFLTGVLRPFRSSC